MSSSFGDKIEDYEVSTLLGKGGFACVYKAKCKATGQLVAIKMIERKKVQESGMVQRVRNEVEIHSRLKHPSILEMYNYFEDDTYIYFILELCTNGEVYRYLKTSGRRLKESKVCHIFKQAVQGVLYLHSHNIVHRDLSLANVLLTDTLDAKISDFGLATKLHVPEEKHYTMCGTPNFIAPEVASRGPHGLESDVWSLGCMLYTLFTGRPPFDKDGDGVKGTLNRVVKGEYEMPKHISLEAQDLIFSLLQKDPKCRLRLDEIASHPFLKNSAHSSYMSLNQNRNVLMSVVSQDSGNGTLSSSQFSSQLQRGPLKATMKPRVLPTSTPTTTTSVNLPTSTMPVGRTPSPAQGTQNALMYQHRRHGSASATIGSCISEEACSSVSTHPPVGANMRRSNSYSTISASILHPGVSVTDSQCSQQMQSTGVGTSRSTGSSHRRKEKHNTASYSCPSMNSSAFVNSHKFSSIGHDKTTSSAEKSEKMSSLLDTTPPLNAVRLAPIKQEYTNSSLSITGTSEVCLEIFGSRTQSKKSRERGVDEGPQGHSVKEILLISCNGMDISVYKPIGKLSGKKQKVPSGLMDCQKFPGFGLASSYSYHELPSRYWELYKHAARIVLAIRSMTPKVVLYTDFAKCKLMENGPNADFDASFYEGPRVHLGKDSIRITQADGTSSEYPNTCDVSELPPDIQDLVKRAKEGLTHCTKLEDALIVVEQDLKIGSCFPIRVRSRPSSAQTTQSALMGHNTTMSVISPSIYRAPNSIDSHRSIHRPMSMTNSYCTAVKQCHVPGVGKAEQLINGSVVVHYKDGSQLSLQKGNAAVKFAMKDGPWESFGQNSQLPPNVKSKLQQVPTVIQHLNHTHPSTM